MTGCPKLRWPAALCFLLAPALGSHESPVELDAHTEALSTREELYLRRIAYLERQLAEVREVRIDSKARLLEEDGISFDFADEVDQHGFSRGMEDVVGGEDLGVEPMSGGVGSVEGQEGDAHEQHGEGTEEGEEGEEEHEEQDLWSADEEEEEEQEFQEADIAMSKVLLGSVFLVMLIFYFVNWEDDDIRLYSWMMVSNTICIFVSVLLFSGIHEYISIHFRRWGLQNYSQIMLVDYLLFLIWFAALHVIIGLIANRVWPFPRAGSIADEVWVIADGLRADAGMEVNRDKVAHQGSKSVIVHHDLLEVFVEKIPRERQRIERWLTCWATLLAHITGFAAINAGGTMMQMHFFSRSPWLVLSSVVLSTVFLFCVFYVAKLLRHAIVFADDVETEEEALFVEKVEEAENDIAGLSVSFLLVQALRYCISGHLPNKEGIDNDHHPLRDIAYLYVTGVTCCIILLSLLFKGESHGNLSQLVNKVLTITRSVVSMMFAWCVLFATRWWLHSSEALEAAQAGPQTMQGRILAAMLLSSGTMVLILVIDKVDDTIRERAASSTSYAHIIGNSKKSVTDFIMSISILVGFSWEHCFDFGVESLSSLTEDPETVKLVLTSIVAAVIIPAWRRHILSKVILLRRVADLRSEQEPNPGTQEYKRVSTTDIDDPRNASTSDVDDPRNAIACGCLGKA